MSVSVCPGCLAVPEPDETSCLFCLIPDPDEEELQALEEQADHPDKQFAEYFDSLFSGDPVVLSEFDEEAFEAYEERHEAISLFLAGY